MPFTSADLSAIEATMARGELTVEFADRRVTYRSADELETLRNRILGELTTASAQAAGGRARQMIGVASKGL